MSVERKPHRSSPHFSQFLDVSSNRGPCWLLHLNQSDVARDWRREEAGRGLATIFRTSELIESQFFARWCTKFSRPISNQTFSPLSALTLSIKMGKQQERNESSWLGWDYFTWTCWNWRLDLENVGFWNWPVKIGLWNVSLSSVWIGIVWLFKKSGLWKPRSDNLTLTLKIWLWKLQAVFHRLTLKIGISTLDWKLDLENFAFKNWTLETRLEIWRLKFVFSNWTLENWTLVIVVSLSTRDVGPLDWTFHGWLWKIHFWKWTVVQMSLSKVDFCLVLHEFFDLWLKMLRPETATIKQKQLTYCLLPRLT